ncbi:MAG: calcium-binding protein [Solirubrobacterales bacterium]
MKKALLTVLTVIAALTATAAHAEGGPVTLVLAGGAENNFIRISLSSDGRNYVIQSRVALETGGDLCSHPEGRSNELLCEAPAIAGFEVNVEGGNDTVILASDIPIPATLRGGPGDDKLIGGGVADKIIGGSGNDFLSGRRGDDLLLGGPGDDKLIGGPGNDELRGGPGVDVLNGGPGHNHLVQ